MKDHRQRVIAREGGKGNENSQQARKNARLIHKWRCLGDVGKFVALRVI